MERLTPDERRKLDEFNQSQGEPHIEILWDHKQKRWTLYALSSGTSHPQYSVENLRKLSRPLPDGSGRQGVFLFTWAQRDALGQDLGYLPVDGRLFDALHWADTFSDRRHFEKTFEDPEVARDVAQKRALRDIAYGARSYFWGLDKLIKGPHSVGGDWRHRIR